MFALEDIDEDSLQAELIEDMLTVGGIMLEQDCDDLRPILKNIIDNQSLSDFAVSIATFTIVYVAREVNNWRAFATEQNIQEFLIDDEIESAVYHIFSLTNKLGKRTIDMVGEELYSFIAEQFIATYEP